jgi:hypothetical protein
VRVCAYLCVTSGSSLCPSCLVLPDCVTKKGCAGRRDQPGERARQPATWPAPRRRPHPLDHLAAGVICAVLEAFFPYRRSYVTLTPHAPTRKHTHTHTQTHKHTHTHTHKHAHTRTLFNSSKTTSLRRSAARALCGLPRTPTTRAWATGCAPCSSSWTSIKAACRGESRGARE